MLGAEFHAFEVAYNQLRRDVPTVGIIHFDPQHRWPNDRTLFDYWHELPAFNKRPLKELERQFSPILTPVFRLLLIKSEVGLLDCQAILPCELADHHNLLCESPTLHNPLEYPEKSEVSLSLPVVDAQTLADMPMELLLKVRASDEAKGYFSLLTGALPRFSAAHTRTIVEDYLRRINADISAWYGARKRSSAENVHVKVSVGTFARARELLEPITTTIIEIAHVYITESYIIRPLVSVLTRKAKESLEHQSSQDSRVKSDLILMKVSEVDTTKVTQYKS